MRSWLPLLVLLAAGLALPTSAAPVTVEFEGVITGVQDDFELLPVLAAGDAFSGAYFYDDEAPPSVCGDPLDSRQLDQCSTYTFAPEMHAGISLELHGESYTFLDAEGPLVPLTITILDELSRDRYRVRWERRDSDRDDILSIDLFDFAIPPTSFLETTKLAVPRLSPDARFRYSPRFNPPRVEIVNGVVRFIPGTESSITGTLTALRLVPEPTALVLLLSVSSLLVVRRGQRREQ